MLTTAERNPPYRKEDVERAGRLNDGDDDDDDDDDDVNRDLEDDGPTPRRNGSSHTRTGAVVLSAMRRVENSSIVQD